MKHPNPAIRAMEANALRTYSNFQELKDDSNAEVDVVYLIANKDSYNYVYYSKTKEITYLNEGHWSTLNI